MPVQQQPAASSSADGAYFVPVSPGTYRATRLTSGAWSTSEQHISPLNGLAVHAVEQHLASLAASGADAAGGKEIRRLTFDILGPVAVGDVDVAVRVVRPGRTVELVEATVAAGGRDVLQARAWRLAPFDTSQVAGGRPGPMPAPDQLPDWDMTTVWPGDFIRSVRIRRDPAGRPGRTRGWVSTDVPLVAGEHVSPLAAFVALVDTANGIGVRESPYEWMFPNVDLTIHLHRAPLAGPVGLDTTVVLGAGGHGVTSAVLHDVDGPVGLAAQSLTVRRRPRPEG